MKNQAYMFYLTTEYKYYHHHRHHHHRVVMDNVDERDNNEKQLAKEKEIIEQKLRQIDKNLVILEHIHDYEYDTFVLNVISMDHHESIKSIFKKIYNVTDIINPLQYSVMKKKYPMKMEGWPLKPERMTIQIQRLATKKIGKVLVIRVMLKIFLLIISLYTSFLFISINK
jgi:hypothetical protein